jgi:hypothetical protein
MDVYSENYTCRLVNDVLTVLLVRTEERVRLDCPHVRLLPYVDDRDSTLRIG